LRSFALSFSNSLSASSRVMRLVDTSGRPIGFVDDIGRTYLVPAVEADAIPTSADFPVAYWDDLRFPAQGINPAGATAPPTVDDVLTSFPGTLLFAGNAENVIAGVAQMPHTWVKGTSIKPHIHWSKPVGSAAAVTWELYYRHLGFAGATPEAWVGPVAGTLVVGNMSVTDQHCITSFGEVAMTGKAESACLCWQIRRQGGTDADNGTARLYEFDIHYLVGKPGTISEIPT
jgi:hypothetical protein